MQFRIERFIAGADLLQVVLAEHIQQGLEGQLDALTGRLQGLVLRIQRRQPTLQVVCHTQQITREFFQRELVGVLHISLGTLAHVLHFGLGTDIRLTQCLLYLRQFGFHLCQRLFGGGLGGLCLGLSSLLLFHGFYLRLSGLLVFFLLTHLSLHIPKPGFSRKAGKDMGTVGGDSRERQ